VESISSRYEKLTGRSPSADLLASSLDDLLKSLKTKFNKSKVAAGGPDGNEQESTNPIDTIQKLIASSTAGKINSSPLRRMQMAVMDEDEEEDQVRIGVGANTKQKSE
jgi:hypothetical protein